MKCPECQHDMHHSKAGWLCMNCGSVAKGPKPKASKASAANAAGPAGSGVPTSADASAGSPPPPSPVADTAPESEDPKPKRRGIPKLAIIIAVVVLLLGGAGAFAFQTIVLGPKQAPGQYLEKLTGADTAVFNGTISFTSDDEDLSQFKLTSKFSGKYDMADSKKPKIQVAIDGSLGESALKGELLLIERMLYFRVEDFDLLSAFGLQPEKDWYKFELSAESLNDDCAEPVEKATANLAKRLPLKNPKLVKLFDKVNGRTAHHYSGSLDMARLPAIIGEVNKDLPANCQIDLEEDDARSLSIEYDLWSSSNFDRLILRIKDSKSKSNIEITLDTSDYNKAVELTAPSDAKEFGLLGGLEPDPLDAERKEELQSVQGALEQFYAGNGYYPSGSYTGLKAKLVSKYLKELPADPGGQAYVYTPSGCRSSRCTGYVLKAALQNSADPDYPEYVLTNLDEPEEEEPAGTATLPQLRALIPFWN